MILQLINALLGLANAIAIWAERRQMINAGEAQIVARALTQSMEEIRNAQVARDNVRRAFERDARELRDEDDGFRRD